MWSTVGMDTQSALSQNYVSFFLLSSAPAVAESQGEKERLILTQNYTVHIVFTCPKRHKERLFTNKQEHQDLTRITNALTEIVHVSFTSP